MKAIKHSVTIYADVYKDSYTDGEGDMVNSFSLGGVIVSTADPKEAIKEAIERQLSFDGFNFDDCAVMEDQEDVVFWSTLVDADNAQATDSEKESWKRGELDLYSCNLQIYVEPIGERVKFEANS